MPSFSPCSAWLLGLSLALSGGDACAAPVKDNSAKSDIEFPDNLDSEALLLTHLRACASGTSGAVRSSMAEKNCYRISRRTSLPNGVPMNLQT